MISTKNFHPDTDPKLICTCGHPKCDKRSVKQSVLNCVQLMRSDLHSPIKINSGGRCPYHPDETHRPFPADHQNCVAVDIPYSSGVEMFELVEAGIARGATAVGIYSNFIHFGWRDIEAPVMWFGK